jgi:hypothetical protein
MTITLACVIPVGTTHVKGPAVVYCCPYNPAYNGGAVVTVQAVPLETNCVFVAPAVKVVAVDAALPTITLPVGILLNPVPPFTTANCPVSCDAFIVDPVTNAVPVEAGKVKVFDPATAVGVNVILPDVSPCIISEGIYISLEFNNN